MAAKRVLVPLLLAAATVALFDVVAWFVLPPRLTAFAVSYHKPWLLDGGSGWPAMTRGGEPRNYFIADDVSGFDIKPGARATHDFGEYRYEIFANSLGCFDRNEIGAFRAADSYTYFAGDSFTWGFADYDSKFATVWEKATGKLAAKCGIPHTGQAHQLEKLKRVMRAIGKAPATVFVGYYVNDPANDAAYPHTTVIGGYQADTVFDKDGELVRADIAELRRIVEASLRQIETPPSGLERAKLTVWIYSLSANMAWHAAQSLQRVVTQAGGAKGGGASPGPAPARATSKFGGNLYYWYDSRTLKTGFATDPKVAANRAAIHKWIEHARENRYRLVFLLFPSADVLDDPSYFAQMRAWLDLEGAEYVDFAQLFAREHLAAAEMHWKTNGHWNPHGNRVVGRLLVRQFP